MTELSSNIQPYIEGNKLFTSEEAARKKTEKGIKVVESRPITNVLLKNLLVKND